jgi:hypothetical protein
MRLTCTLALTCLLAACVPPPKAVEVPEDPAAKPRTNKPAPVQEDSPPPLRIVQTGGMKTPDLAEKLPDSKDMRPTAEPVQQDGPTVRAKPPGASE